MKRLAIIAALTVVVPAAADAQEAEPSGSTLTCVSEVGARQHCAGDTSGGVALVREVGPSACLLGQNWGYDDGGVWVADGCGGEFVLGGESRQGSVREFLGHFEPYGRFLGHLAIYDGEAEVQDNASWLGMLFSAGDGVKFFAGVELGINIFRGPQLNAGATTQGDILTIERSEPEVFGNRLGYLGVDFGAGGRVTLGKQNSVHYDIAGFTTDRWNVFGGQASLAYPAGTDGGQTGTGRIDQAITYRNTLFDILDIGVQTAFRSADNDNAVDGFGFSGRVSVLPSLRIGASYTKTLLSDAIVEEAAGLSSDESEYVAVGVTFGSDLLDLGAVVANQSNGDFAEVLVELQPGPEPVLLPVVFDATGVEIFAKVKLDRFAILGGFIDYEPDSDHPALAEDFRVRYGILGGQMSLSDNGYAYTEWRIFDDSVRADGSPESSVFTFGFYYAFRWKGTHGY